MPRAPFDSSVDYYTLLGVAPHASASEIRAAYRRQAKTFHPDLNAGSARAAARMARLNVAKAILLHPETRAAYDAARWVRYGSVPQGAAAPSHASPPPAAPRADRPSGHAPRAVGASRGGGPGLDRPTLMLLALALPLLLGLLVYVVDAAQVAARPVRPPATDLALGPTSRPNAEGTARAAFAIVAGQAPSRRTASAANQVIRNLVEGSPEAELVRAAGRRLLQAAAASDAEAWQQAVAELCVLAVYC